MFYLFLLGGGFITVNAALFSSIVWALNRAGLPDLHEKSGLMRGFPLSAEEEMQPEGETLKVAF